MIELIQNAFGWFREWCSEFFVNASGVIKDAALWLVAPGIRAIATFTGLALTTYGMVVGPLVQATRAAFGGIPGDIINVIAYLQIDKVVTMVLSAYVFSSVFTQLRVIRAQAQQP